MLDRAKEAAEPGRIPFTMYVVADLDSQAGLALMKEALESIVRVLLFHLEVLFSECMFIQRQDSMARISFIHNPTKQKEETRPHASLLVAHLCQKNLLSGVSPDQLLHVLGLASVVVVNDTPQTVLSQERTLRDITGGLAVFADLDTEVYDDYVRSSRLFVRELQLNSGDQAIIVNGRVSRLAHSLFLYSQRPMTDCWPNRLRGVRGSGLQCLANIRTS